MDTDSVYACTDSATVVPFAAIGCADSFRMVLDSKVSSSSSSSQASFPVV